MVTAKPITELTTQGESTPLIESSTTEMATQQSTPMYTMETTERPPGQPSVVDVQPLFGPQSGGTSVTLTGEKLSFLTIYLGHILCHLDKTQG